MPKICYRSFNFSQDTLDIIETAERISTEYAEQGYDLTLRQLYYQFVARAIIPNTEQSYKRLGSIINDARLAGMIDWDHITDRTRNIRSNPHWDAPMDIIRSAATQFRYDLWQDQPEYVEVWIEKDALVGVISGVCTDLDVPYFSCRGYTSQSEMWAAAQRIISRCDASSRNCTIIHLGDHDPSGIDMTRDIRDRLELFTLSEREENNWEVEIERIALNMDQVRRYNPPPNPAKITDARAAQYIQRHGSQSWELDALDPATLSGLVRTRVTAHMDMARFDVDSDRQETARQQLTTVANQWPKVLKAVNSDGKK